MSSRGGFARADIDVGLMHDQKVRRLARLQNDPVRTAVSVMLYQAAVLDSWRDDEPARAIDSAPSWFTPDPGPYCEDLIAVGLLDSEGRVPVTALDEYMASSRAARSAGTAAARKRWSKRAPVVPPESDRNAMAMPSLPNLPTPLRAPAREDEGPTKPMKSFRDAMADLGVTHETLAAKAKGST